MAGRRPHLNTSGATPSSRIAFKIRNASCQRPHCAQAAMALLKANTVGLRKGFPENAGGVFRCVNGVSIKCGSNIPLVKGFPETQAACFVGRGNSRKKVGGYYGPPSYVWLIPGQTTGEGCVVLGEASTKWLNHTGF